MKLLISVVALLGVLSAAAAALAAGGRPITEKVLGGFEHLAASNSCETPPSFMDHVHRFARGRREVWSQRVLSGGPWPERIGPVWNSAFICR